IVTMDAATAVRRPLLSISLLLRAAVSLKHSSRRHARRPTRSTNQAIQPVTLPFLLLVLLLAMLAHTAASCCGLLT
ncbi:hypothetical protein COO60DRAFT_1546674, partial [Scenedesmus sp. NREL 46B-D3]